ncbi:MAG: serine/threonine protein kinase [Anaerolineae bacterium]|nr:serine/threonine protein kinase [Anaerolineae bacterium]
MNNQSEKIIGNYPIVKQIARSPQGLVFLSKSPTTNTPAIVKFYPSKLAQSPAFMKQFMNELSHLKQLVHPNILPITAYGLTDKFPSIEVPYMLGGDLATRIQNGTNWAHFKDALGQICQALVYAHRQGVIHGNLKPSNILFNQKGDAYLSDFRLTCLEDYIPYTLSDYSSPEQIRGERLDQRSDVYSLGVLIYVWVTGQKPPQSALTHSEHEYEPLSLRWDVPNISVTMDEVIQQATQYDRANRFSSVKEFYHAFFDALRVDKMFLQMLSSVKSDVTQFSQETSVASGWFLLSYKL